MLAVAWLVHGGTAAELAALRPGLALLALQGTVLAYLGTMVWYAAIARLDLARTTAIVVPSIPVLSLGATFVLLGEIPTARQALGTASDGRGGARLRDRPHADAWRERIPSATAPLATPTD